MKKIVDMDKAARDNRANQLNPNHTKTGPGHKAGYGGSKTKADLDNRSNQFNPNNPAYRLTHETEKGMNNGTRGKGKPESNHGRTRENLDNRTNSQNSNNNNSSVHVTGASAGPGQSRRGRYTKRFMVVK